MNTFIGGLLFCGILVIMVLWWYSGRSNPNNKMLALSLLCICYTMFINHCYFTGYIIEVPHFSRTGLISGNLIFPFLYVYIRNSFYPGKLWRRLDWWLLTPAVFCIIDLFPFYVLSGQEKAKIFSGLSNNQARWRVDQGWFSPFWLHFTLLYSLTALFWILIVKMVIKNQRMEGERISKTNKPMFSMIVMLTASYFIISVPGLLGSILNVPWFNVYFVAFSLSLTLFVVLISLVFSPQVLYGFVYHPSVLLTDGQTQMILMPDNGLVKAKQDPEHKYADVIAPVEDDVVDDNREMEEIFLQIDQFMNEKKPFTKQNLSIHELASEIGLPVYALSKAINSVKGINYNKWLNQYRIAYFIDIYRNPNNQQLTLEALAQKAGFISRVTFIKNFKSEMGDTPTNYIKIHFKKDLV